MYSKFNLQIFFFYRMYILYKNGLKRALVENNRDMKDDDQWRMQNFYFCGGEGVKEI